MNAPETALSGLALDDHRTDLPAEFVATSPITEAIILRSSD